MSVFLRDRAGPWTLEDLAELGDDGHGYEIVDGLLLMSPPEMLFNTRLAHRLAQQLARCRLLFPWRRCTSSTSASALMRGARASPSSEAMRRSPGISSGSRRIMSC